MAQLTYKAMKDNAALKNLPILTLDQRWYRLVPESVKTDEIRYWEKRVNELLKKQGQVNEDLIQVKKDVYKRQVFYHSLYMKRQGLSCKNILTLHAFLVYTYKVAHSLSRNR